LYLLTSVEMKKYRVAVKFLAGPGREKVTATEVFVFHISYL